MSSEDYYSGGGEIQVIDGDALATLERASIDTQIATAKQYPRSMSTFIKRACDLACIDETTAGECIYNKPVGKDKQGRQLYADGMSIRMAEIIASCYGNFRAGARIISQTPKQVVAQGIAYDLESNVCMTAEVVVPTVYSNGTPMKDSQAALLAQGALSKAMRNAIFRVIPKAIARPVEEAVRRLLVGDAKSLSQTRADLEKWVRSLGIDPNRVWHALGGQGLEDLGSKEILTLRGIATAIKNGDTTIDDAFPEVKPETAIANEAQPAAIANDPSADYKTKRTRKTSEKKTIDVETSQDDGKAKKMQEVREWVENGCSEKADYEMAIRTLVNFAEAGQIKPQWLQDAQDVVRQVALEKGFRL